jgi:phosphatidylglycerophosphate synthase
MAVDENRRPISQRSHGWAKWLTGVLVKSGVTPNFISFTSIVFAALAGLCFYAISLPVSSIDGVFLALGAALFCQLRLLSNMMDGMVAVEAGKAGKDGLIWNELPDRFADVAVLVGAGYCVSRLGVADASLGWAAALAAVMTAYVREVGRAAGAPADFSGPMAKPHRMFVMTMAALIAAAAPLWFHIHYDAPFPGSWPYRLEIFAVAETVRLGLWIVLIGSTFTALNRARRALVFLNK